MITNWLYGYFNGQKNKTIFYFFIIVTNKNKGKTKTANEVPRLTRFGMLDGQDCVQKSVSIAKNRGLAARVLNGMAHAPSLEC
jgi:hypothetical protein